MATYRNGLISVGVHKKTQTYKTSGLDHFRFFLLRTVARFPQNWPTEICHFCIFVVPSRLALLRRCTWCCRYRCFWYSGYHWLQTWAARLDNELRGGKETAGSRRSTITTWCACAGGGGGGIGEKHWNRGAIKCLDIFMEGMLDYWWLWKIGGDLLELELLLFYLAIHRTRCTLLRANHSHRSKKAVLSVLLRMVYGDGTFKRAPSRWHPRFGTNCPKSRQDYTCIYNYNTGRTWLCVLCTHM